MKKLCRYKKRLKIRGKLAELEEHYVNKNILNFYQEAKRSKSTYTEAQQYYKSKEGYLIDDTKGKLERWQEYFKELLNDEGEWYEEDNYVEGEDARERNEGIEQTPTESK